MVYHKYSPFRWRKLKQRLKAEGSEVVTIVTDRIEKLNLQGFLVTSLSTQSSAQSSARENFFQKKYTHAGSLVNTAFPACCIYHFTLQILQSSAQNPFRAEDFCSIIIEAHHKSHRSHIYILHFLRAL